MSKIAPIKHGTTHAYARRSCRCRECVSAHARRIAAARARRAGREPPARVHGTPGGYTNWGCRCEACTAAHSAACKEHYARLVAS